MSFEKVSIAEIIIIGLLLYIIYKLRLYEEDFSNTVDQEYSSSQRNKKPYEQTLSTIASYGTENTPNFG